MSKITLFVLIIMSGAYFLLYHYKDFLSKKFSSRVMNVIFAATLLFSVIIVPYLNPFCLNKDIRPIVKSSEDNINI